MHEFEKYIVSLHQVSKKHSRFYAKWVNSAYARLDKDLLCPLNERDEQYAMDHLRRNIEDWQVQQATKALNLYRIFLKTTPGQNRNEKYHDKPSEWLDLEEKIIRTIRFQHKSRRTEKTYLSWIMRFALFLEYPSPNTLDTSHITTYLSHLANNRNVAASTQNQAMNALVFLFRFGLEKEPGISFSVNTRHI